MKKSTATGSPRTMAVELTAQVRKRLKVYAAERDVKIKAVVNEALDEYLKKRGA